MDSSRSYAYMRVIYSMFWLIEFGKFLQKQAAIHSFIIYPLFLFSLTFSFSVSNDLLFSLYLNVTHKGTKAFLELELHSGSKQHCSSSQKYDETTALSLIRLVALERSGLFTSRVGTKSGLAFIMEIPLSCRKVSRWRLSTASSKSFTIRIDRAIIFWLTDETKDRSPLWMRDQILYQPQT